MSNTMNAPLALAAALATTLAAGCFSERSTEPQDTNACDGTTTPCLVEVRDNSFSPATRRVTVGSTVRWTNEGASPHTSTALDNDEWDSGNLNSGQSFEHTFEAAGSFDYECIYHSGMTGTIVVE